MCGICGIINFHKLPIKEASIREMMHLMKHRGPDDEGVFLENHVGLGFVRLSIIDLSPAGHQPKLSSNERYVVVFNGEIYNYIELREELKNKGVTFSTQTDTEVLLNAYIHWGEDCMRRFNGMWAFVIYDRKERTVFASRDRFGIKPFYYLQTNDFFAFCSEIPPLLSLLKAKPNPNYQTIFDFLVYNRTDQTENTFFSEIRKLQHGNKLKIIENQIVIEQWYNLRNKVAASKGFDSPLEYKELLSSAIGLQLRSDVPVGVCLSGGLDSSSIVSVLLQDYNKNELNTFSAVYKNGQVGDETEYINEYRLLLKNMFYITPDENTLLSDLTLLMSTQVEPFPSTSPYAQFKVMELAKGNVVVTLDGQGADEQLAGYHYFFGYYFKDLFTHGKFSKFLNEIVQYLKNHKSTSAIKLFFFFLLPAKLRAKIRLSWDNCLMPEFQNKFKNNNTIASNLYGSASLQEALFDHFEYKLEHLLKWSDRNSMRFSIESRVPFLDYRLVEKTLASSSENKIRNGTTKYILREAMKGILPVKIQTRVDKMGFSTPEANWFRSDQWQKVILDMLNSKSFKERGLIDPNKAICIFRKHVSGKADVSKEIWKWLNLELWFRMYID
ncbi:MAG: asparagine synthase (glutamine-hydrolyzing) [Bacteroidetes bacterium]|nr:asparagine synthase (glutamine-hydrolyzing) [Bacteroidota bacterium]